MNIRKNSVLRGIFAACSLMFLVSVAKTDEKPRVESQLSAFKVVKSADGESLTSVKTLKPGETLEYQLKYSNETGKGVKNVQVVLPIPAGLEYVSSSVKPSAAQASTDGKTFAAMPLKRAAKNANGVTEMVNIPASQYRFLRWTVSALPAGANSSVSARVRLVDANPAAKTAATLFQ